MEFSGSGDRAAQGHGLCAGDHAGLVDKASHRNGEFLSGGRGVERGCGELRTQFLQGVDFCAPFIVSFLRADGRDLLQQGDALFMPAGDDAERLRIPLLRVELSLDRAFPNPHLFHARQQARLVSGEAPAVPLDFVAPFESRGVLVPEPGDEPVVILPKLTFRRADAVLRVVLDPLQHDERGEIADQSLALAVVDDVGGVHGHFALHLRKFPLCVQAVNDLVRGGDVRGADRAGLDGLATETEPQIDASKSRLLHRPENMHAFAALDPFAYDRIAHPIAAQGDEARRDVREPLQSRLDPLCGQRDPIPARFECQVGELALRGGGFRMDEIPRAGDFRSRLAQRRNSIAEEQG